MNKGLKKNVYMALIWVILALVVGTGATFAWFTFTTSTNVTPMEGTISGDGVNLLISNKETGPFDTKCDLILSSHAEEISPVTTYNLADFYTSAAQSDEGIITSYKSVKEPDNCLMRGSVYIKSEDGNCDLYFDLDKTAFGDDVQAMAAMRLGIQVVSKGQNNVYIFSLDDVVDLSKAKKNRTTEKANCVYNGKDLVSDPAKNVSSRAAKNDKIISGAQPLGKIVANEIVTINYYFYLEGCDENCINSVMSKDVSLSLGFWGMEN